jgi:hypothetical protein
MSRFYVAWSFKPSPQPPEVSFEYLIHPGTGEGGVIYCNAIVEATDKEAAWSQVCAVFAGAARQRVEVADDEFQTEYATTKRTSGVKTIKAKVS